MASSSNSVPTPRLAFGIEMEFLIRPKQHTVPALVKNGWDKSIKPGLPDSPLKIKNRAIMRTVIADTLQGTGVSASTRTDNYEEWTVTDERSLDEVADYWHVELVSKTFTTVYNWQLEVDLVFQALDRYWDLQLTTGCSMHVHVSPGLTPDTKYTMDQLRRIMKGVCLFDDAITKIMPGDRKNNEWAMSNVQGRKASDHLKEKYAAVPARGWAPLFDGFDTIKMKPLVYSEMGPNRYLSWNFGNIVDACGTVEFRRPPGVRTAAAAKHWVGFTLAFVAEAMRHDYRGYRPKTDYPPVSALANFVMAGIGTLERTCQGSCVLQNLVEDRSPAAVYTTAELREIARKKADKETKSSAFVEKANSRPNSPVSRASSPGAKSNTSVSSQASGKSGKKSSWY